MFRAKIAVRRLAAVAAAALSVACSSSEAVNAQGGSPALAHTQARTPLVDDDGWPMPADPPIAAAPQKRVAR